MRLLLLLALGILSVMAETSPTLKEFSAANNQLAIDIYKKLLKSDPSNILICPLSVEIVLSLTHAGAKDVTAQQLATTLHLPDNSDKIQEMVSSVTRDLRDGDGYVLKSANKIYVDKHFKINKHFNDVAVNNFQADVENVDFSKNQETVPVINKWVEDKTGGNIKNLLLPTDVDADTRAVLINTLFFQSKWAHKFSKSNTKKKPFYLSGKSDINVDMMSQTDFYDYYESSDLNAKFLEMYYQGFSSSMVFVLPNEKDGLAHLEDNIDKIFTAPEFSRTYVEVGIPKFKLEMNIKLKSILTALGIEKAFGPTADFTKMGTDDQKRGIFINKVIQKNFVEIDEDGTTAASVAAVIAGAGSALPPPEIKTFIADHPFIFYIKKDDTVLFLGRVTVNH